MDDGMEVASPTEDATLSLTAEQLLESLETHEDVVSWINDILDVDETLTSPATQPAALGDLDRRVTQLVGTLELASEDTTTQVERLIDDISRGASRLTYDLHFMREGALSLQALLHNVETKSKASVAADTNAALDRLHFLDTVKHNMEAAREVLKEAESWSTLESDVISLLGEQNYERAAERLSEASKSMVVFEGTPEYDARRTLMVSLQNQLEAALSSALVAAVNSQDVAVCRNYFAIFCNIQRESEFRNYYYGSRKAALLEQWQHARLRDGGGDAGDGAPTFAQFLPGFFQAFLAMLQTERTAIAAIFPDPQPTLSTLITTTLSSLQPSFPERLAASAAHHGAAALPQLIAAYQAAQEFALATDRILEKIGFAAQPAPAPGDGDANAGKGHLRRRSSTRMSVSRRIGPHRASISGHPLAAPGDAAQPAWDQELFEPFLDFQNDYGSWEHRFLKDALRGIMREEPGPAQDRARLVRERAVDVVSAADEAIARCMAFTHGYAAAGLVEALDTFLRTFVDDSKADISSAQTSPSVASASGDLSDLDYTPKDWADIQSLLHTLEAIRDLHERVLKFEGKLRGSLVQVSHTFRLMRGDPAGLHISGTTRGAVQLLAQSSLNSMELHDLLERVDPDPHTQSQSRGDPFLTPTPPASGAEARRPSQVFHLTPGPAQAAPLLVGARDAISGFAKACQVALQETILAPLRKRLAGYPSSPVWVAQADARRRGTGAGAPGSALSEVHVPTFSLSPTDTMQRVAEGLLNLPRLFEVYADDDALAFSLETLPHVGAELLRALAEPAPEAADARPLQHARRASSLSLKAPPAPAGPPELTPEAVSAAWLASLGRSLLAHLTAQVLPGIRFLSASGAAQLASDLGYLASIVMALNIEDTALERWKEYVELDDAAGRERLKEDGAGDAVLATVAKLRGWTTA